MEIDLTDIKDVSIIAKPFVDPIVSTLIKPKLEKLGKWLKKKKADHAVADHYWENKFEEFLYRTYKKSTSINVLVFPNQQINIAQIYQPLTLVSSKDRTKTTIEAFEEAFIKEYQYIIVSDDAGMGNSTLTKWITKSIIEQSMSIPVLIELKRINKEHTLLDEIYQQLDPIDGSFDKDLILRFLKLGSFTILLDGFDEIEYEFRTDVIQDIKTLVSKADKNWFILTSRPDPELSSFNDFQGFKISELKQGETFELIDRYDQTSNYDIGEELKEDIKNKLDQVKEFLANPFLTSLLYKTYTYNKNIPAKKSTFYDEVYSALYKNHDWSKDGFERNKKSGLDFSDFRLVLRRLAFDSRKVGKTEYSQVELAQFLRKVNSNLGSLTFKESDFADDLLYTVPLFSQEGNVLRWAHKSLQDYFMAEFVCCHESKKEIIARMHQSEKPDYLSILDFIIELDPETFRETIMVEILVKYRRFNQRLASNFINQDFDKVKDPSFAFGIDYILAGSKYSDDLNRKVLGKEKEGFSNFFMMRVAVEFPGGFEQFRISYDQEILNLLGKKDYAIVEKIQSSNRDVRNPLRNFTEFIFLSHPLEDQLLDIKFFNKMTSYVSSEIRFFNQYKLNHHKALAELEKIEKEIAARKEEDLLDGI